MKPNTTKPKPTNLLMHFQRKSVLMILLGALFFTIQFKAKAQSWDQIQKIVASDRGYGDAFARDVAISGNYAIVGAYAEKEDVLGENTLTQAGSVYIFEQGSNGEWTGMQKLVASDRASRSFFGFSVAISGDYAIVGAYGESRDAGGNGYLNFAGSAYIYERNSIGEWQEVQKIVASDRGEYDYFGFSVSISGDYAIVGAYFEDEDAAGGGYLSNAGSAYIFERDNNGGWQEIQKIVASDRERNDEAFGYSVSISGDHAIIGAYSNWGDENGDNDLAQAGAAYMFERSGSGQWQEVQKIVASDRETFELFGNSVAICGDYAVVGDNLDDEDENGGNTANLAGSAYVFERDANGDWQEVQKIVASDREATDFFGISVAISGNQIIVGANSENEDIVGGATLSDAGSAYIFERDGSGTWTEIQKIVADDRSSGDQFGFSVSVSGGNVLVGAYAEDHDALGNNTLPNAGSAYIFAADPCRLSDLTADAGGDQEVFYGYLPTECVSLMGTALGGVPPYTYSWDGNPAGDSIQVCPTTTTSYTLTVTDANGCEASDEVVVEVTDVHCGNKNDKVLICHLADDSTLCVSHNAVAAHLAHGDYLGSCNIDKSTEAKSMGQNTFEVFPNPSSGSFVIRFEEKVSGDLTIQSVAGDIVYKQKVESQKQIELQLDLPKGLYQLRVTSSSHQYTHQLLIQ